MLTVECNNCSFIDIIYVKYGKEFISTGLNNHKKSSHKCNNCGCYRLVKTEYQPGPYKSPKLDTTTITYDRLAL
jgi:deoxycytidylate deaminase